MPTVDKSPRKVRICLHRPIYCLFTTVLALGDQSSTYYLHDSDKTPKRMTSQASWLYTSTAFNAARAHLQHIISSAHSDVDSSSRQNFYLFRLLQSFPPSSGEAYEAVLLGRAREVDCSRVLSSSALVRKSHRFGRSRSLQVDA